MFERTARRQFNLHRRAIEQDLWSAVLTRAALVVVTLFSVGNFQERIIPDGDTSNIQQYIVIAMWIVIAVVSFFRRKTLSIEPAPGVVAGLALYFIAIASVGWSHDPLSSLAKVIALCVVMFGAYRLITTTVLDEIVECLIFGLFILNVASVFLALFVPDIGVLTNWQHAGQWNGIFFSKQTLGITGALLLFFACYRLLGGSGRLYYWAAAGTALACIIGSGSRGGGALAVVAVACVYLAGASTSFAKILAFGPFFMSLLGGALIFYFVWTGNKYLLAFGEEIDFTERTFIWQHALGYFSSAPLLGYGLNGFWTIKDVRDRFIERYGWFLDNYHDGYIAIVMETGLVGLGVFMLGYLLYGLRILKDMRAKGALDSDAKLALVYTCQIFFIDFTETIFLRSTNIFSTMLVIAFLVGFARQPIPARTRHSVAEVERARPLRGTRSWRGEISRTRRNWRATGPH